MMKIAVFSVIIVILIILVLFAYTWYRLYVKLNLHAESAKRDLPNGWEAKTQYVVSIDGQRIAYWYFPADNSKATVILIHGYDNPGGKTQMLVHAKYLHDEGYSTVLLDLRAYGESDRNKMTLGVNEWKDVEAVYDQVKSLKENSGKKIGFFGVSMGGATAVMTAGKTGKGDFVIASVPYLDFSSLFRFQIRAAGLPPVIFYPFMKVAARIELGKDYEQFSPLAVVKKIKSPIFLISAKNDEEISSQDAKILFDLANQPKQYWEADSKHDIFYYHPEEFKQKVISFLEKYGK